MLQYKDREQKQQDNHKPMEACQRNDRGDPGYEINF